jgi:hypothetical protein
MAPLIEYKTKQQLGEILVSQSATENKHSGGSMSCTPIKVDRLSYWLKGFDFNSFNYLTVATLTQRFQIGRCILERFTNGFHTVGKWVIKSTIKASMLK